MQATDTHGDDVESDRLDPVARPRRRLVLVSQNPDFVGSDHEWDPDTESIGRASEGGEEEVPELSLNLRPRLMQTVPWVLHGASGSAIQEALQDCDRISCEGHTWLETSVAASEDDFVQTLSGGVVPRRMLEARITSFEQGAWLELLAEGASGAEKAQTQSIRRRRRQQSDDDGKRTARDLSLVHTGELSSARQAFEGAPVAPGTMATLRALTDPEKQPQFPGTS